MNLKNLPKIELHCHLDGSLRPETIVDIAKKDKISIPSYNVNDIRNKITIPLDCKSLDEYLKAFEIPNLVMQSKENLKRITFEVFEDSARENVKYMEIRFAPQLHTLKGLTLEEIIQSVIEGIRLAESMYDIKGNVILCCMRNMDEDKAFQVIEDGKKFIGRGVAGIDLCSSEDDGFCERFLEPIKLAREYGYGITIHAGETGISKNVIDAVRLLGAERIGHGVAIKNSKEAYKLVKAQKIALEMCPTSNVQTKAVNSFYEHPIYKFLKDGIRVTLNTDNRTVSNTTMTNECQVMVNEFDMSYEDYRQIYFNSVDACFTDSKTKEKLKEYIK